MKAQRFYYLGLAVLSSALVLLSGSNVVAMSSSSAPSSGCTDAYMSDGDCDLDNNTEECGYDGGDCCDCTCIDTTEYVCGTRTGFSCLDPSASCFENGDPDGDDDDDAVIPTVPPTVPPTAPSSEVNYVEAGTKTTVSTSANAYDDRPGAESGGNGCQVDGCGPELTRDGITAADAESRWSCAAKLVPGGLQCAIDFVFEDPQDIMDVEVAFFKGDERSRTVEVMINDEVVGQFDSYAGSTFNSLGIQGTGAATLTIKSVGLTVNDWLSFTEVRFLVAP